MGPICVLKHLSDFLPSHPHLQEKAQNTCSAAPFGSASILSISYAAIKMLGSKGLVNETQIAILHANYMASRLKDAYPILFTDENGFVAHEFIIDCRAFKKTANVDVEDIAKRLMDYGFHAPTMSWPVAGTMMIEPTESEGKDEMDRFCDALLQIREEIRAIEENRLDPSHNMLKLAPHPIEEISQDLWPHPYTRKQAAYPLGKKAKVIWPSVARINNAQGDRHLICSCTSFLEV